MPTVSLCMVVKDEEQLLEKCLGSIQDAVDEIIIVDTGSKDKTIEIARKYTSMVYSYKCKREAAGAGCEARNESLKYATKDWVFVIDGDELFETSLVGELKKVIQDKSAVAYTVIQRNYTNNFSAAGFVPSPNFSFFGYYDNRITRLFRRDPNIKFSSDVHEQVDPSILKLGKKILHSDLVVHHLRELKKIERDKQLNYLGLYEQKLKEEPNDIDTNLGLAIIYQNQLHNHEKAIHHFLKVLELNPKRIEALINLSNLFTELKRLEDSKKILDQALKYYPNDTSILNNYTVYNIKSGNLTKANEIADKILKIQPNNINALINKGFLHVNAKNYDGALQCFDKIISLAPVFLEARVNRALALIRKGDYQKAEAELEETLKIDPNFKSAKGLLDKLKLSQQK